tara:strand:- start:267 stop:629 length:363 start_codon:yes stop_codon:yes gene_type:complete
MDSKKIIVLFIIFSIIVFLVYFIKYRSKKQKKIQNINKEKFKALNEKRNKLKIENPDEYNRIVEEEKIKKKEKRRTTQISTIIVVVLVCLNNYNKGPAIIYFVIALIPFVVNKLSKKTPL